MNFYVASPRLGDAVAPGAGCGSNYFNSRFRRSNARNVRLSAITTAFPLTPDLFRAGREPRVPTQLGLSDPTAVMTDP